jgi:proline dehydrogenase
VTPGEAVSPVSVVDQLVARTLPFVPKPLVGRVSRRYIAGETLDDATSVVKDLNRNGIRATLDVLGEFITTPEAARRNLSLYIDTLDRIERERLGSNVSVKLSSLGLLIDPELCHELMTELLRRAREHGQFVRIDMEDSGCTQATFDLFRRLRQGFDGVGVVIQSYLRRTAADAAWLGEMGANVRICKGIYNEPREIAFKDRELIRRSFIEALRILLERRCYVGIATHDEILVWEAERRIHRLGLSPERYEFQMLLGVDEQLRSLVVKAGHAMRVYVPFGREWYAYSLRRLRENPRIAGYVMRATLGRRPSGNGSRA